MILPCIDADKNPAAGNNSDGPPAASGSSVALAANNSNTAHATAQTPFSNSITDTGSTSNTNNSQVVSVAATSTGQSLQIAQESGDQSNEVHQCNSPTLLIPSSEGSTAPSRIQPFHHVEAGEQIQKEVEVSVFLTTNHVHASAFIYFVVIKLK